MQKKYLSVSIAAVLVFIAIVLFYITSNIYIGIYPIGIITGICVLVQMAMLFLSCKNIKTNGYKLNSIISISVDVFSIMFMGYFFIFWLMVI